VSNEASRAHLDDLRRAFRARMAVARATEAWREFRGRIALVLSGGGARGAYEAGALLAFQDAELPTPIVTATSIGGINAASYVAHSDTLVGNAEALLDTWSDLTPPSVGIEWTRYAWITAGLIAASAGFGNLTARLFGNAGVRLSLSRPALTWLTLGVAGACIVLFYDKMSYAYYVFTRYGRGNTWRPDERKLLISAGANLLVASFVYVALTSLPLREQLWPGLQHHPWVTAALGVLAAVLWLRRGPARAAAARLSGLLIRLPMRTGLFQNYERIRLLRRRIPFDRIRFSPIRLVLSATDLERGVARFFTNTPIETLATDPGASPEFVHQEIVTVTDLMPPIIASSALPIAYEPLAIDGRLHADGAIVGSQPIRPAVLLGADVLFLVMMEPPQAGHTHVRTFIDVGLRSLEILMRQNFESDLEQLRTMNALCERAAVDLGVRVEEIEVDAGGRWIRYIKALTIHPATPLPGTILHFDGATSWPAMVQGYRDACERVAEFAEYARTAQFPGQRRAYRLTPERSKD
jgi:predicted acylesterase/phospholipase RssA